MRLLPTALLAALLLSGCGASSASLNLERNLDEPAVYRISTQAESSLSGSDLESKANVTAALVVRPAPGSKAEVEVLHLAASVEDAEGNPVALSLGDVSGTEATVKLRPPGNVASITGDEELLGAPVPLISPRGLIAGLFPPLPGETMRKQDTWTGDTPAPLSGLGDNPVRMRYVLDSTDPSSRGGSVNGYELSLGTRSFETQTPSGPVTGQGKLNVTFEGKFSSSTGYEHTRIVTEFDTDSIHLPDGKQLEDSNLHLESRTTVERLTAAEQLTLDVE